MSKFAGTGPSSYKKRIYRTVVSQRLRNAGLRYALLTLLNQLPGIVVNGGNTSIASSVIIILRTCR